MKKLLTTSLFLILLTAAFQAEAATGVVPFKEYNDARQSVFNFFDTLASYNAYIVGDDGQMLGYISRDRSNYDSINNDWGSYGNPYRSCCIFNDSGTYGSNYSDLSPFNEFALRPPTIRYKQGGTELVVAYLTSNTYFTGKYSVSNISPNCLCDWLKADKRCR